MKYWTLIVLILSACAATEPPPAHVNVGVFSFHMAEGRFGFHGQSPTLEQCLEAIDPVNKNPQVPIVMFCGVR